MRKVLPSTLYPRDNPGIEPRPAYTARKLYIRYSITYWVMMVSEIIQTSSSILLLDIKLSSLDGESWSNPYRIAGLTATPYWLTFSASSISRSLSAVSHSLAVRRRFLIISLTRSEKVGRIRTSSKIIFPFREKVRECERGSTTVTNN